jgi:cellulose synthase/poly-beta-1,6-N-acetylglucosamine synthase-like glycosyltransferase
LIAIYAAPVVVLFATILCAHPINNLNASNYSISIIVAARNEKKNVLECLIALTKQHISIHQLEIIVVDDDSSDGTFDFLQSFAGNHKIRILRKDGGSKYKSSKKHALEIAVSEAKGDILLFTDADCHPGPLWAMTMHSFFEESTGMVAGFSPQKAKAKFWSEVMKIDAAAAAFVAAGTIAFGRGVTCTGRNLAIRKQALLDVGGYKALPDSLSGDDDFMLQKISSHLKWQVKYAYDSQAVVPAAGPKNVRCFLDQKRRHISAGKHFQIFSQLIFALYHLANLGIWVCLFIAPFAGVIYIVPFILKLVFDLIAIFWFLRLFKIRVRIASFILWQPLFLFYNIFIGPLSFVQKLKWKAGNCDNASNENE